MLPGWFGFGAAVDAFLSRHGESGLELLRAMYRHWSFFRTLLSNMDMVLFKSDVHIASRYAELMGDAELREDVFGRIREEMQRSIEHLLASQSKRVAEWNPSLAQVFCNRVLYRRNHLQLFSAIATVRQSG
jgi:phosphoenolpyruvate carboxylase